MTISIFVFFVFVFANHESFNGWKLISILLFGLGVGQSDFLWGWCSDLFVLGPPRLFQMVLEVSCGASVYTGGGGVSCKPNMCSNYLPCPLMVFQSGMSYLLYIFLYVRCHVQIFSPFLWLAFSFSSYCLFSPIFVGHLHLSMFSFANFFFVSILQSLLKKKKKGKAWIWIYCIWMPSHSSTICWEKTSSLVNYQLVFLSSILLQ